MAYKEVIVKLKKLNIVVTDGLLELKDFIVYIGDESKGQINNLMDLCYDGNKYFWNNYGIPTGQSLKMC